MTATKAKAFLEALKSFSINPAKAKSYLTDRRLTHSEKVILECFFHLRDNELDHVDKKLLSISEVCDPFVESQKNLLLGILFNNKTIYDKAIHHIHLSLDLISAPELNYFKFVGLHNLFTIYFNLENKAEMRNVLDKLKSMELTLEIEKIRMLRCLFLYYSYNDEFKKAENILKILGPYKKIMVESDIIAQLLNEFCFYVKLEDFEQCQKTLVEMKSHRKFHLTENYNFMKKLLAHYLENKPIYFQDSDFHRMPILLYQIKVIQQLEENKHSEAMIYWEKLREIYPNDYLENFQYKGEKNIFSLCLKKNLNTFKQTILNPLVTSSSIRTETILEILALANAPIRRELLFELVWGRAPQEKVDFLHLSKMIYKLKKKYEIEIFYRKGCYSIENSVDKKKKAS